ncbi:SMI1/KNR4 family protein [Devosia lacusdianchii]|uniref:SMI1/KNR4 family protein n=1 Tax=Devosia lacusdianchii TaxID=2917991 RepID=UPI001F05CBD0|nr:SMI1/KNR4 family protein [Devosia sp. JXJ CY 41]
MDREALKRTYSLNEPASPDDIASHQAEASYRLPSDYEAFLRVSNGLYTDGRLALLELEAIYGRNADYEVQEYLPGYVMIGDDSGGTALVMKAGDSAVYEVGMGSMDIESMEKSAASLEQLLVECGGKTLRERR